MEQASVANWLRLSITGVMRCVFEPRCGAKSFHVRKLSNSNPSERFINYEKLPADPQPCELQKSPKQHSSHNVKSPVWSSIISFVLFVIALTDLLVHILKFKSI